MAHLPPIVSDLAMILLVAGITTILFKKLNQPLVLGYIVAGFITGPHFSFFPTVTDFNNIHTWSEIGIIFLMLYIGYDKFHHDSSIVQAGCLKLLSGFVRGFVHGQMSRRR